MKLAAIQGKSVVKGFPELIQRACDKEADARVLLQTEYGLARRRATTDGTRESQDNQIINRKSRRSVRTLSDGELFVPDETPERNDEEDDAKESARSLEIPVALGGDLKLEALPSVGNIQRKSVKLSTPPGTNSAAPHSPVPPSRHQAANQPGRAFKSTAKRNPYGGRIKAETPRQKAKRKYQANEQREIKAFLKDREAELVVLVEGIDVMTSATLQARHSYRWDD